MRIRIVFLLKNKGASVPFHHQYLLTQLIEKLLLSAPEKYRDFRNYNFSGLKGQTKVSKNGLHFYSSRVTLVFSSPNEEFLHLMLTSLFRNREIQIGNLLLEPEMVEQEEHVQLGEEVKYVCISPLVLVTPDSNEFYAKKFIPPDTDIFSDLLYESTMSRMERTGNYTAEQIAGFYKFQIVPDKDYLSKIKEGEKKFARIYPVFENDYEEGPVKLEVRGYTFPFTLYAVSEVQHFLFTNGLGSYTDYGFGMIDLATADLKSKVVMPQYSSPSSRQVANGG